MKTQHTPGPWAVITETDAISRISTTERPMRHIADVVPVTWDYEKSVERKAANAKLIAAAPTLAEALKALLEDYVSTLSAYNEYREYTDGMSAVPEDDSAIQARAALAAAGVLS